MTEVRSPFSGRISTSTRRSLFVPLLLLAGAFAAGAVDPGSAGVRPGTLPKSWITGGPKCMEVPDWQVHEYNPDLYILRESGCIHYEKPFLYVFFGSEKVMVVDTGSGNADATGIVSEVIAKWLRRNQRNSISLIVAHSHSHDDHTAGDARFAKLPNTILVPLTISSTQQFFGIQNWPDDAGKIDLGDRVIDVIPIPGHDKLSVAFYDRQTGILHAGDSLYPGRLYVADFAAFARSTQRLVNFTKGKTVSHIVGCHIEQTRTPFLDYPIGSMYQPDEHSLELSRAHLLELNEALHEMGDHAARLALRDFTIWPVDDKEWESLERTRAITQEQQLRHMWDQSESK
jgi:glyoxylase-like metal-dependent hydrolase (beta-lactamase superfamily II)